MFFCFFSGHTVITTIHQPSSSMYRLFDTVLLMSEGRIAYYGPADEALDYFAKLGFEPEPNYNPADFLSTFDA